MPAEKKANQTAEEQPGRYVCIAGFAETSRDYANHLVDTNDLSLAGPVQAVPGGPVPIHSSRYSRFRFLLGGAKAPESHAVLNVHLRDNGLQYK